MRRVTGEGRMAYVLVAVGALMAAAGLYVIGYGWIEARYEEYWNALGAGATLVAGGVVTLALGFAVRALLQVKAAFVAQPLGVAGPVTVSEGLAAEPTPLAAPLPKLPETEPVAGEPTAAPAVEPDHAPAEPSQQLEFPIPPVAGGRHPLRPPLPSPKDVELASAPAVEAEPIAESSIESSLDEKREPQPVELDYDNVSAARPADDYKLETPSTPEHDLVVPAPPIAEHKPRKASLPRSNDWFDRALADIDEELPLISSTTRESFAPTSLPQKPPAEAEEPELEPAMVGSEPVHTEAADQDHSTPLPAAGSPGEAVIGRYEAEGTSYVMYADGSIEAQSSAGVYRFASMAELKAFIES